MPYNEYQKQYSLAYAKEKLKRVPLDLKHSEYEELKEAADKCGESVNGFIKKSIRERIQQIAEK